MKKMKDWQKTAYDKGYADYFANYSFEYGNPYDMNKGVRNHNEHEFWNRGWMKAYDKSHLKQTGE